MNPAITDVLAVLERLANEGWHRARGKIAAATLEIYPFEPDLHAHRALAALETDGVDAARRWLRASVVRFAASCNGLPEAVLEAYRAVAVLAALRGEHEGRTARTLPATARTLH